MPPRTRQFDTSPVKLPWKVKTMSQVSKLLTKNLTSVFRNKNGVGYLIQKNIKTKKGKKNWIGFFGGQYKMAPKRTIKTNLRKKGTRKKICGEIGQIWLKQFAHLPSQRLVQLSIPLYRSWLLGIISVNKKSETSVRVFKIPLSPISNRSRAQDTPLCIPEANPKVWVAAKIHKQ